MNIHEKFDGSPQQRRELWRLVTEQLDAFASDTESFPVAPLLEREKIKKWVEQPELDEGLGAEKALDHVLQGMKTYTVHTTHPSYYGLFNPRASFPSVLADTITAAFNPQMAAWSHAPFANEVESFLIGQLAGKLGYSNSDGVFTSGGAEANQTAVLCALNEHFPHYGQSGLMGIGKRPLLYCSTEVHHSVIKAARSSGLGSESVRQIPVDKSQRMDCIPLENAIREDIHKGHQPFMVIATAGTTGTGSIDPLKDVGKIVDNYGLWFHVDAAYGGALALSSRHRHYLQGIERSDSLTFDIHKWPSVPMGCSAFITSHEQILSKTFGTSTDYMPRDASGLPVIDPFTHSIQWSRRFIGLKLYLSLLAFGWNGYQQMIDDMMDRGEYLGKTLRKAGWQICNDANLPVICFTPGSEGKSVEQICREVVWSGKAWISVYPIDGIPALRACITNYLTSNTDVDKLVGLLERIRKGETLAPTSGA